jgi:hypothetical protein
MSLSHSPKIVTNGLVLCLDASDKKSYPGTGTTWYDRSGNGYHGTLAGGVSYSSSNGGLFDFDGINGSITIPINLTITTYTIIAIARYKGTNNSRIVSSPSANWLMGWWGGQTNKYYAEGWVSASSGGTAETNWICYAATGDTFGDSWQLYRNGVLIVGPNTNGSYGPNGIKLGGWSSSEFSACQASYVIAYNRVLTPEEIKQNFDAIKGRFGI